MDIFTFWGDGDITEFVEFLGAEYMGQIVFAVQPIFSTKIGMINISKILHCWGNLKTLLQYETPRQKENHATYKFGNLPTSTNRIKEE